MAWSFNNVNKVILVGRLGKDPELSYLPSGQSVAKFSMATSRRFKDKSGEWRDETEWHNIVAWGKLGELCSQHLSKGRQAYVEGQIRSHSWEDREGKKRTAVDIVADTVVPIGPRTAETGEEPARPAAAGKPAPSPQDVEESASQEITDDDIPF